MFVFVFFSADDTNIGLFISIIIDEKEFSIAANKKDIVYI